LKYTNHKLSPVLDGYETSSVTLKQGHEIEGVGEHALWRIFGLKETRFNRMGWDGLVM